MRLNRRGVLYAMVFVVVCFWSANFIVAKVALRYFPPLLLSALRIALAALFILPVYWWNRNPAEPGWTRRDLPGLLGLGVLGIAGNQIFFVLGIHRTSVAHAAIIIAMSPICVLLTAILMRQEHFTPTKLAGMVIALAGVGILNLLPARADAGSTPGVVGDLLVFLAGFMFAIFTVLAKRITQSHSSITVNTLAYVGAMLALTPATLMHYSDFRYGGVNATGWLCVLYMALFPSVICYLMYFYALSHIPASRVAAFSYLQPVLATAMAIPFLGEHLTLPLVAGAPVIFTGVYLAERG